MNHNILISKLEYHGIRGPALDLLKSYLSNRNQIVKINNTLSNHQSINIGVPQGSILGPLLFIIYVNDIAEININSKTYLFADDTAATFSGTDKRELTDKCLDGLNSLNQWFLSNRLTLNLNKTNYIVFKTKNKPNIDITLNIGATPINQVSFSKYLGIIIDEKLSWKDQINALSKKISMKLGILYYLKSKLPSDILKILYYSFIYPHIHYCICIWGFARKTILQPLFLLQKRAIRIICKVPYLTHTKNLFKKEGILSLEQILTLKIAMVFYDIRNLPKHPLSEFFTPNHNTMSRRNANYQIPYIRIDVRKNSLFGNGILTANSIFTKYEQIQNKKLLTRKIKENLLKENIL